MKILVLGAGGMAGHVIAIRLQELGHSVTGLARRSLPFCEGVGCDTVAADAANSGEIEKMLCDERFDAVINAIGILPKAISEDAYNGIRINACLPHLLARLTADSDTRIIHLSTDCVFSGRDGGSYSETDFPSAADYYGRSKALGELDDGKNLTFRTSIVGPDVNENGVGLFHWFMRQSGEVRGYRRAIWTGVTTVTLADAIDAALQQRLTGLYHLVNGDTIDKYELLGLFNGLRTAPIRIRPDDGYCADKSLVSTRTDFQFAAGAYSEMIREMGQWIARHKALYPHYDVLETEGSLL